MRLLIYQLIGRLDYRDVIFEVDGGLYGPTPFSSFAITSHFVDKRKVSGGRIKLLIPLSVEKPSVGEDGGLDVAGLYSNLRSKLSERIKAGSPVEWDIQLIPSFGAYSEELKHESTPQAIATRILIEMLRDLEDAGDDKVTVVVDVSTGWNGNEYRE